MVSLARVTESRVDKLYLAMRQGLIARALRSADIKNAPESKLNDFSNHGLFRMAEHCVREMGLDPLNISKRDIADLALLRPASLTRYRISREAAYSTGRFPELLEDAASRTLTAGYTEAEPSFKLWAREATPAPNLQHVNRVQVSEMSTPEEVPEGAPYPDASLTAYRETYRLAKFGSIFSVTWETVVNDDVDAISRIPALQGAACRRKQNQVVYHELATNPAMADGGELFNTDAQSEDGGHANSAGTSTQLSVTSLNAAFKSMNTKYGTSAENVLSIEPRFLIVPSALTIAARQLVASITSPADGDGDRPLKVITEPVLDSYSSTAWYLASDQDNCDTIEITFLAGEETPTLESKWDRDLDLHKFKVRQAFGVKAIDYRGLYRNLG